MTKRNKALNATNRRVYALTLDEIWELEEELREISDDMDVSIDSSSISPLVGGISTTVATTTSYNTNFSQQSRPTSFNYWI